MSDLFQGQTMTEAYQFQSPGVATTFEFSFQPDKVVFNNLTKWGVAGAEPISAWFRDQTVAAQAYQQQVIIDNGITGNANFINTLVGGFTVANTAGGVAAFRALIAGVSLAPICVITTTAPHGFQTDQIVRITDLGIVMPAPQHGMTELDGRRFLITVLTATTFSIRDVITDEPVDSTLFTPWNNGGRLDIESRVITLNNPQQPPYNVIPYIPNPYAFEPIKYRLLVGTAIMGALADTFLIEVYKFGQVTVMGQL